MAPARRGRPARDAAPRIFLRRGVYAADLRRWNAGRTTLRNPDSPGWPAAGDTTEDPEVALRWALRYVDSFREEKRREHLKLGPRARLLGEACEEYVAKRKVSSPSSTWQGARSALNALRRFAAADKTSGRKGDQLRTHLLTPALLQRMFDALEAEGFKYNTLASYRRSISGFLRHLGYGGDNAALRVRLTRPAHEEVATWTDEELEKLRAAADRLDRRKREGFHRMRLAIELALSSGVRRNELFALDWSHIDAEALTVRVARQIDKTDARFVPTKSKRARLSLLLPSWWAHHQEGRSGLIFPDRGGAIMSPNNLTLFIRRLLREAELERPGLGWHTFRHTYARDFIVGVRGDFGLLQKSLGHRSITTTERLYGHFHDEAAVGIARSRIYPDRHLKAI